MNKQPFVLEDSLGYLIGRATRSLGALLNRNFHEAGLDVTCEQWSILFHLGEAGGLNQQDLASLSCKDKTSMTRLIDGMESHDLVVRVPDKTDRRQKLIYLTNKGKQFRKKLLPIVYQTLEEASKGISLSDMAHCKKVLHAIYENICSKTSHENGCTINLMKTR